jgi:type II restriction enzyme
MIRCITLHCNSPCHSPGFFTLADVYAHVGSLAKLHLNNRHVRDKIRQQLQVLRDLGLLTFLGSGSYRLP